MAKSTIGRGLLKTFGTPALYAEHDGAPLPLRQKDLALLVYLRVEHRRCFSRSALACLLWGDSIEQKARHSLSQGLRRLQETIGPDTLSLTRDTVVWQGHDLACDAALLDDPTAVGRADDAYYLRFYAGDFLTGLFLGCGASDFDTWAAARRVSYRLKAATCLARRAEEREREGAWPEALQLALRAVEIEPLVQAAHRSAMRAWHAVGEQALAIKHYRDLVQLLRSTADLQPDPLTRAAAEGLMPSSRGGRLQEDSGVAASVVAGSQARSA